MTTRSSLLDPGVRVNETVELTLVPPQSPGATLPPADLRETFDAVQPLPGRGHASLWSEIQRHEEAATAQPPVRGTPEALRKLVELHMTIFAAEVEGGIQSRFNVNSAAASACLRRLRTEFAGSAECLSAEADFCSSSARLSTDPAERRTLWQTALQSLESLRREQPRHPLTAETLVRLAETAYSQAARTASERSPHRALISEFPREEHGV